MPWFCACLHELEAKAAVIERVKERGDITGREDIGRTGSAQLIDKDAVVGFQPRPRSEINVALHANPGNDKIGLHAFPAGAMDAVPAPPFRFDCLDHDAGANLGACPLMQACYENRGFRRHAAAEGPGGCFKDGNIAPARARRGGDFQPDHARADAYDTRRRPQKLPQAARVLCGYVA